MFRLDTKEKPKQNCSLGIHKKWEELSRQIIVKDLKIQQRKELKEGNKEKRGRLVWLK